MLCYSVAHFLGGIIGAAFLWGFSDSENSLGAVARQDYVTPFFFELFGTAVSPFHSIEHLTIIKTALLIDIVTILHNIILPLLIA